MNNRSSETNKFLPIIIDYMQKNQIPVPEFDTQSYPNFFDRLIEDPNIQRLLSLWIEKGNTLQLAYILETIPLILMNLEEADRMEALNLVLEYAQNIHALIPKKTEYDLAIESIQERLEGESSPIPSVKDAAINRWADFNRLLCTLTEQDVVRLKKYAFFINGDVFSANTVLDMDSNACAVFDARVKEIIEAYPSLLLPDNNDLRNLKPAIFEDELFAKIKKDPTIQNILAEVIPSTPMLPIRAITNQAVTRQPNFTSSIEHEHTAVDLDALLGLHDKDDDSTIDTTDQESYSSKSTNSKTPNHSTDTEQSSTNSLSFWQLFNIQSNEDLAALVELEIITPRQVPDRGLTQQDEQRYAHLVERVIQTALNSDKHFRPRDMNTGRSTPSSLTSSNQTTPRSLTTAKHASQPKRKPFVPVIKDDTYNIDLQRYNREQRRLDPFSGQDLSKKQQDLKKRMPQHQQQQKDITNQQRSKSAGRFRT